MGDLFDVDVKRAWRLAVFKEIRGCPQHTFYILTKQPNNITVGLIENTCFGVTVNCNNDVWRIKTLKARTSYLQKKFVSFEPLYEDLTGVDLRGFEWIAIGAQTRPNIQPKQEWVERLIRRAHDSGTRVVLKNNLTVKK